MTAEDRTAAAAEAIQKQLRADGYEPSGIAESGNLTAAYGFVVEIDGHDYEVEIAASILDDPDED